MAEFVHKIFKLGTSKDWKAGLWLIGARVGGNRKVLLNKYEVSFWSGEKIQELDSKDNCKALYILL